MRPVPTTCTLPGCGGEATRIVRVVLKKGEPVLLGVCEENGHQADVARMAESQAKGNWRIVHMYAADA